MTDLPDIEELYPYMVKLNHKEDRYGTSLKVVKWLEANKIMNIVDFHLEMNFAESHIAVLFKKKLAKIFKENKKAVRDAA